MIYCQVHAEKGAPVCLCPAASARVECCSGLEPLVAYSLGCSVVQPRSRFAAEADGPGTGLDTGHSDVPQPAAPQAGAPLLCAHSTPAHATACRHGVAHR